MAKRNAWPKRSANASSSKIDKSSNFNRGRKNWPSTSNQLWKRCRRDGKGSKTPSSKSTNGAKWWRMKKKQREKPKDWRKKDSSTEGNKVLQSRTRTRTRKQSLSPFPLKMNTRKSLRVKEQSWRLPRGEKRFAIRTNNGEMALSSSRARVL